MLVLQNETEQVCPLCSMTLRPTYARHIFLGFKNNRNVSYTGHALGGLAGLLVGSILLENRKVRPTTLWRISNSVKIYWLTCRLSNGRREQRRSPSGPSTLSWSASCSGTSSAPSQIGASQIMVALETNMRPMKQLYLWNFNVKLSFEMLIFI